ncbi:MAG TPA: M6 family metalloprotease domain-containing protein, partial [Bacteroidota bacterium]|nr:M6 family metalloprotease domain-containing protein [Bacteroidota bacterium]
MKLSITLFFCLLAFPGTESILASVPPHSRVLELIRRGEIPVPYYLKNLANIRSSGVNAPWSAPRHRDNMGTSSVGRPKLGLAATPAGSWRALVILTQFTDHPSSVSTTSFDQIVFGTSFGTVHDYYHTVSYGRLDIVTVNLPSSTGWKTMPHPYSYYVNGQNGFGSYPQNAQRLVEDALNAVAGVVDFKNYDNDGDGYVDALFVVHSGPGAEFTGSNNDIWSHSWTTSSPQLHNGVYVFHYAMVPEYWSTPGDMTCGVYCHELGHALFGLPDLYDTDYSSEGLGRWTIMAGGSWNGPNGLGGSPALMDAWCLSQMGFAKILPITANTVAAPIYRRQDSSTVYRLWRNGNTASPEYFLVENRQQAGYDSYLPGNGLCV